MKQKVDSSGEEVTCPIVNLQSRSCSTFRHKLEAFVKFYIFWAFL